MATDLNQLKKATRKAPRILVYGGEGVGKTTFACGAPDVYLMDLERGAVLNDPLMIQEPTTYTEVMDQIKALCTQDHPYRTLVIDSLDALETMCTAHTCKAHGWTAITEPAYGKGYGARTDECWAPLWRALDYLVEHQSMIIILIAHSRIVKFEDPVLPEYDMYEVNLYKTEKSKAVDWPDVVGFCTIKTYTTSDGKRNVATTAGERVILTQKNPAYSAKTRYGMPEEMPLNWADFAQYFRTTNTKKEND